MRLVLLTSCIFLGIQAAPALPELEKFAEKAVPVSGNLVESKVPGNAAGSLSYAADMTAVGNSQQFNCLKSSGYGAVFLRAYSAAGEGTFDNNVIQNLNLANAAGLLPEVYMVPQIFSKKTGAQQLDEIYNTLTSKGFQMRSIWIQVINPQTWHTSATTNYNFISSITNRARALRLAIGIYTSAYDWNQIISNTHNVQDDVMLWYWRYTGAGDNGESPDNFDDYQQIGRWKYPTVKQYGENVYMCYTYRNLDVYSPTFSIAAADNKKDGKIMIGSIGIKN